MGRLYCHTEKKSLPRRIFEGEKIKFTFSSVPVMRTSFDKRLQTPRTSGQN
jgi:hypothetical protein